VYPMTATTATTLDAEEIAKFSAIAEQWWDEKGKFAPLHRINPVRLKYIRDHALKHFGREDELNSFTGLTAIDIGCGGGLVSEPLARMGFAVTGIDGGEKNIKTASVHAAQSGLSIEYQATTAEELAAKGAQYDAVFALEIIEHVADVPLFLESVAKLVKPGGMLVMSTLNRTIKAYGLAIIGAEYVLRWLPRGTHDWKKFVKPHEMAMPLQREGLTLLEMQGLVLNPFSRAWEMSAKDLDVNYMMVLKRK
jgi:2-polyprenyl-6-hydroxyphenyl methylase / 3-demethylubiquinone-9 3-methyltransferase